MSVPDSPSAQLVNTPAMQLDGLHHEVLQFTKELFVLRQQQSPIRDYAQIRDRLLQQRDRLVVASNVLIDVVRAEHGQAVFQQASWREFVDVARAEDPLEDTADRGIGSSGTAVKGNVDKRKQGSYIQQQRQERYVSTVAALWGPEVVAYHGWDKLSRGGSRHMYKCATAWPNFAEFVKRANAVMLARHKASLHEARAPSIGQNELYRDIESAGHVITRDFKLMASWSEEQKSQAEIAEEEVESWAQDPHGSIEVAPGVSLQAMKKQATDALMLSTGKHGLLIPRRLEAKFGQDALRKRLESTSSSRDTTPFGQVLDGSVSSTTLSLSPSPRQTGVTTRSARDDRIAHREALPALDERPAAKKLKTTAAQPSSLISQGAKAPPPSSEKSASNEMQTSDTARPVSRSLHLLICEDKRAGPISRRSIEESLHDRYHTVFNKYAELIRSDDTQKTRLGDRRKWLPRDCAWALTWASPKCGKGRADVLAAADVLYYTSDEFVMASNAGHDFTRPIVVKEASSDSSSQTLASYQERLSDYHDLDALPIEDDNVVAVGVHDITDARPPHFVISRRFWLLDTLRARLMDLSEQPIRHIAAAQTLCVGAENSFYAPHVEQLGGRWYRNLDGIKLCVFQRPDEQHKLILLDKDDVLYILPGLDVELAMHFVEPGLLLTKRIWDEQSLMEMLSSIQVPPDDASKSELNILLLALMQFASDRKQRLGLSDDASWEAFRQLVHAKQDLLS